MIVYEIRKPEPVAPPQVPGTALVQVSPSSYQPKYMDKVEFAKWIPDVVERFKPGAYCTLASTPIIERGRPKIVFEVVAVCEIHYLAALDSDRREPKCVNIRGPKGISLNYPPSKLRLLTDDEVTVVNSANQQEPTTPLVATVDSHGDPILVPIDEFLSHGNPSREG